MLIKSPEGATRVCGKRQGFHGLPIRDQREICSVQGEVNAMVTAWEPTPKELEALKRGASVHVVLTGVTPLPMRVEVGPIPGEDSYSG